MGERGEFLPAGPTRCTVEGCPLEGVHLVNGRKYCGGHAAELIDRLGPPPRAVSMPARLVLIENDDRGGVRSRPETVDAIGEVVQAWRALAPGVRSQHLFEALAALAERWPQ